MSTSGTTGNARVANVAGHVLSCSAAGPSSSSSKGVAPPAWNSFSIVKDLKWSSGTGTVKLQNFVNGEWCPTSKTVPVVDPLNGDAFIQMPLTETDAELQPFLDRMHAVPKSGLHNPLKQVNRYTMYGRISFLLAKELEDGRVIDHFARLIQRVVPKSYAQAYGEVSIVHKFLQNFCADQVRFLARGFHVSGDHDGQQSQGYRFPFGPVMIIAPFNFPLEIPVLQLMGALYMGNHVTIKGSEKCSIVLEDWIRLMLKCGMPPTDVNLIHGTGPGTAKLVDVASKSKTLRAMQFTGSNTVAKAVLQATGGKVRIEDAGFNWKVMGPDVRDVEFVTWMCDQDAYANCGQKCSATSILVAHSNWMKAGLVDKLKTIAGERSLGNLSIAPVLTHTTSGMLGHVEALLKIPGARLLFGGKALTGHSIPAVYGAIEPTAVFVPLAEILKPQNYPSVTAEIFGPVQVITEWSSENNELERCVIPLLERMDNHLTACVCSNDEALIQKVLGSSVNGTTYCGIRGRTTGAPQNHWFGPGNDPRSAGIGSPEAIQLVWSGHREIIRDMGPVPEGWTRPKPT
ncbi:unnamed protein product [Amoebophrya sp. A25]|nr:unnamed protein product [Amoebophrya sp. A25]|eukprot:GSA25T00013468001.1